MITTIDLQSLLPLLIISGATLLGMLIIAVKRNQTVMTALTLLSLVAAFVSLFYISNLTPHKISPLFIIDQYALFYMGLLFAGSFVVIVLSHEYMKFQDLNIEEYYLLMFLATLGSTVMVISQHFVSFFLGLELLSVSLYTLIAYMRSSLPRLEAGLKYLILAAASSAFLIFGMALIYAGLGSMQFDRIGKFLFLSPLDPLTMTGLAMLIVGIGFKLAVVPFHMWTPDVYQGAPAPVTAFIATVSKGGVFAFLLRFSFAIDIYRFKSIFIIFSIIAILSMLSGNILALMQRNLKRILAYSSIAHLGYLLVAFLAGGENGSKAATFYLTAYFITILGAFAVISLLSNENGEPEDLDNYGGLFWQRPFLSIVLTGMMLSLAGIPLTAGFIGKYYILSVGVGAASWLLVVVLIITSVIGLFYYLRVVVTMFSSAPAEATGRAFLSRTISLGGGLLLAVLMLLLVGIGIYPHEIIGLIQNMVSGLEKSIPSLSAATFLL